MSLQALNIITQNKRTKNKALDLGNCGLTELPPEVLECIWLETLILSSEWWAYDFEKKEGEWEKSQNEGEENRIAALPTDFSRLSNLRVLVVRENPIQDLFTLVGLGQLQELNCTSTQVSDLSPLSGLSQLQRLYCSDTQVSNLSPLSGLSQLQLLSCCSKEVIDLCPLSRLSQLQIIYCYNTQVNDLSPLSGLSQLRELYCHNTQVCDLSPLSGLNQLQRLYCSDTQVSDLLSLSELNQLRELYCSSTQVCDLSPLSGLSPLQRLNCSSTQVSNLSPLSRLSQLQELYCSSTQVCDLSPLSGLNQLQRLNCSSTQVSDLSPLSGLSQLQELNCYNTQVSDLTPLSGLNQLQKLKCNGNRNNKSKISDLAPLSRLSPLQQLDCSFTQVSDLSLLSELIQLQKLDCSDTQVSDLSPLSGLSQLQKLYCSSTQVIDLSPLSGLSQLQQLYCSSTQVSDLSLLSGLSQLQKLDCSSTQVSDLSSLSELSQLQQLNCSSTQVSDLSPLSGLNQLQNLDCSSTQVIDLSPLSGLSQLQKLRCNGNWNNESKISDLAPLSGLSQLQELDCSFTQVSDLSVVSRLNQLQQLSCSTTQVRDLLPLSDLNQLQELNCVSTQVSDLSPLSGLSQLQNLYCSSTQVSNLMPLSRLSQLKTLFCSFTQVSDLSPLAGLLQLQTLNCSSKQISDLSPLSGLIHLQNLYCSSMQVSDLSPLSGLNQLQRLDYSYTQVSDLSPLSGLSQLQQLECHNTQVSDLSPLSGLGKLQHIRCYSTQVSDLAPLYPLIKNNDIPVKWQDIHDYFNENSNDWHKRPVILVKDCPLVCPPAEVAQESPQAVLDYFEELGEDGKKLNEVKVVFLGDASAGKTSLVRRLRGEHFNAKESQTHGIRIRQMPFVMNDGDSVTAHLWDFGGQEMMHATHQFFLSQRSVYVLLLNSRNDDQAEKWLKYAASFGGKSPVLVVLNKIDENPSFEVNRKTLREKYPQIVDFFRLSAAEGTGLSVFSEALRQAIDRSETRRTPFPKHWLEVKQHFSNMTADYIESAEYQQVCIEKGVVKPFSRDVLLQFLHDLGVIINFRNLKNFETQILNPLWLTNGVYRIINSKIVGEDTKGILCEQDFDKVINDPRFTEGNTHERTFHYPKNKLQYIVRVMEEFELCFMLDAHRYVVPQLLSVQEPEFESVGAMLHFVIHFPDFMPDSVFPRLMVKLHTYIDGDRRWRTGMVLHKPAIFKALARVRWDKEDQKILIDVCGEERRRFLSFIRETVKEIVEGFTNLKYDELVPVPECDDVQEYEYLVEAEKANETEVFIKKLKKRVLISDLLDGVEEPSMRDAVEQLPVRAFVSYAHADLEHLKALKSALSPLVRLQKLQIWDDRDINAGDEWGKVIFQQLEEADIVLCLVSADFVASDFCYKREFAIALEAHKKGEKTIVPILLRKTDWKDLPLADIQGVPTDWITSAANKDEAWTAVSESLRPALVKTKQRKKALLEKQKEMR